MNKIEISALLVNPRLVRWLTFIRPHRLVIRFYLSSFISSYIQPENSALKIISGYGKGLHMALRIGDKLNPHETYYWLGFHELDVQRLFAKIIKKAFVIYDIGASLGFYSLLAARMAGPGGKVYAFEPLPRNVECIRHNISLNGMENIILCIPKAVRDKSSKAVYREPKRDDWCRFVDIDYFPEDDDKDRSGLMVEAVSLDEFVFQEGYAAPKLIKIDVEGAEGKVLSGARRLLKEFKPFVICELHCPESAIQVYEELIHLGYKIGDLKGREIINIRNHHHIFAWPKN